ncbi:hypothetical protein XELAEV_18041911mg [Xenopus laevis]|uniref:Uncharacterized protein n=1 Tax=Xenopus laevis TaxID=8355 RepID=A0A974H5V6_XENLA|nr:hypothetical protein XELAEV_18041911mg [Xenopus laevis]
MGSAHGSSEAHRIKQAEQVFAESPEARGGTGISIVNDIDLKFVFRNLERAMRKEIRLWWDVCSLENYLKCERIPRGLRIRKFPAFEVITPEFEQAWNETLTECSMNLMRLILERDKRELAITKEEINDLNKIYESNVKNLKRDKFQRDKRDYDNQTVYLWKTEKRGGRHQSHSGWERNSSREFSIDTPRSVLKPGRMVQFAGSEVARFQQSSLSPVSSSSFLTSEPELSESEPEDYRNQGNPGDRYKGKGYARRDPVYTRSNRSIQGGRDDGTTAAHHTGKDGNRNKKQRW